MNSKDVTKSHDFKKTNWFTGLPPFPILYFSSILKFFDLPFSLHI